MSQFSEKILIYRIGQLGDTLVSLPALWTIRRHFSQAEISLLYEKHPKRSLVTPRDVLTGAGLIDSFISYRCTPNSFTQAVEMLTLLHKVKRGRYHRVIYLPPSVRQSYQCRRDETFFRLARIPQRHGFDSKPLPDLGSLSEAELIVDRLARDGLIPSNRFCWRRDVNIQPFERNYVGRWRQKNVPAGRALIAFAPGSNMPAKRWPLERYMRLGRYLIDRYAIWPLVLGGADDALMGQQLIDYWGCGSNAAGQLPVRLTLAVLECCRFYVGNDTGSMHMAAAAGIQCVALFSGRDRPGKWHPLGSGHLILRQHTECRGCMNIECSRGKQSCMEQIDLNQVTRACDVMYEKTADRPESIEAYSRSGSSIQSMPVMEE